MTLLSDAQMKEIRQIVFQHGGMLSVTACQHYLSELDATIDEWMLALLPLASELAVMPISGFRAAAVALGATGNIYLAANQEFKHLELNQAVHAEQAVIAVAHYHGETNIEKIAINANPCGHCRQFLFEQAEGGKLEILVQDAPLTTLSKLLPHAFGPKDLHIVGGLLTPQQHVLVLDHDVDNALIELARQAAVRSYAPYSKAYSGVALQMRDGRTVTGSYLENVAFNPSLPAMQSAFVALVMYGCRYDEVVDAAFVQVKGHVVDQEAYARLVLAAACPNVSLHTGVAIDKSL